MTRVFHRFKIMEIYTFILTLALISVIIISSEQINPTQEIGRNESGFEYKGIKLDPDKSAYHNKGIKLTQDKSAYHNKGIKLTQDKSVYRHKGIKLSQDESGYQHKLINLVQDKLAYHYKGIKLSQYKAAYHYKGIKLAQYKSAYHYKGIKLAQTLDKLIDITLTVGLSFFDSDHVIDTLNEDILEKIFFIPVEAHFESEHIYMCDLKTLKRRGKTTVNKENGTYRFQILLGFEKLFVSVRKWTLTLFRLISLHGSLDVPHRKNSFLIDLEMTKSPDECEVSVKSFKLVEFDPTINVRLSRAEKGSYWRQKAVDFLFNYFQSYVKSVVENLVIPVMSKIVKEHESIICEF